MKKVDIHEVIKLKTIDKGINNQKQATEFEKSILPSYSLAEDSALVKQALELAKQRQVILKHANKVAITPPPIPQEQYEIAKQALEIVREQKKLHDTILKQIATYKSPFIAKNDRTNHTKHEPPSKTNHKISEIQSLKAENKQLKARVAELEAFIDEGKPQYKPNNLEIENQRKREVREKGRQIASKEWRNSSEKITKKAMAQIVHKKLHDDKNVDPRYIPQPDTISRNWLTNDIKPSYIKGGRPSKKPKK